MKSTEKHEATRPSNQLEPVYLALRLLANRAASLGTGVPASTNYHQELWIPGASDEAVRSAARVLKEAELQSGIRVAEAKAEGLTKLIALLAARVAAHPDKDAAVLPGGLEVLRSLQPTNTRKSLRSLRQMYDLYIMDRIEHYKNSLTRDELLRLSDRALTELQGSEHQALLTDVLAQEAVDDLIKKHLRIEGFETWRKKYPRRRAAQRSLSYWGFDLDHIIGLVARQVAPGDGVLVIGDEVESCAYLLAAYDADVTLLTAGWHTLERAEKRVAEEALSASFDAYVVQFGKWIPSLPSGFMLVVVATQVLESIPVSARRGFLRELQALTQEGGSHVFIPGPARRLLIEAGEPYKEWVRQAAPSTSRSSAPGGTIFVKADDK